ncbi:MAG: type II secretion system F family protein [Candidatus Diapherotrites archaeon]|nr:type II secretion system F family protein [Candidatus Diapherotrites archaeon]
MIEFFYSKEKIKEIELKLLFTNEKMTLKKWISITTTIGFCLFCISGTIIYLTNAETEFLFLAFFASFFTAGIIHYFLWDYFYEKKKKEIEELIPDMLLSASIFSSHNTIEEVISFIAYEDFGLLSIEFLKAEKEIKKGASIPKALENISKRINSGIVSRTMNLMIWGYESGTETRDLFKETAEDLLETKAILSERNATTIIEKYTLIIAGGFIVPMILGLIVKMVLGLNVPVLEGLSIGLAEEKRNALLNAALQANNLYIIEFALISSYFISLIESNQKKAVIYALILVPLAVIVYNAMQVFV